jgi:hypothetical protein
LFDSASPGLSSDFRDIVMKEFDSQVCLQFSQLATKRKWCISADISTYNNSSSVWEITCHPAKVTLFGEPAQVCASVCQCLSRLVISCTFVFAACDARSPAGRNFSGSSQRHSNDFL